MYVDCSCGEHHWGHLGAAGLLLADPQRTGVVLQHRSADVHQGDTWGLMGGALGPGESPIDAALREAHEEAGLDPGEVSVVRTIPGLQHPEWTYTYVLAEMPRPVRDTLAGGGDSWESNEARWVQLAHVEVLRLHPALRTDWSRLAADLTRHGRPRTT